MPYLDSRDVLAYKRSDDIPGNINSYNKYVVALYNKNKLDKNYMIFVHPSSQLNATVLTEDPEDYRLKII